MTEERSFKTSSIPIGIYGLSPSTDSKISYSQNSSIISPIGSPITTSFPSPGTSPFRNSSYNSPLVHDYSNSHGNIYETEPPYLNFDFIFEDDDIVGNFDKLSINNKRDSNSNTLSPNRRSSLSSGPKSPLLKQNSLPTPFIYSSQERRSSLSYKSVLQSTKQHNSSPQFLNVPGKKDGNQSKTPNYMEDDTFDLFGGFEIETPYSKSYEFSHDNNPLYRGNNFNLNSFNPGSLPSQLDLGRSLNFGEYKHDYSSSISSHNQRSPTKSNTKLTFAPNYNLKHCSRIITVQNAHLFRDDMIISCFEKFGELRSVNKVNNTYFISYYDLRCAQAAMQNLNNAYLNNALLELSFHFMREFSSLEESNQGTLVVFNLDQCVSIEDLYMIFGKYGEIREIRESPNKKHKFIEFYDVREADMAMRFLNKTQIKDKKIKIEPSRPGGNKNELNKDRNSFTQLSSSAPTHSYLSRHNEMRNKGVMTYSKAVKSSHPHNLYDSNEKRTETQDSESKHDQSKFELDINLILAGIDHRTSLMIKNIPNKYNQEMLLAAINKNHEGLYDFFYLPIDFKNKCNVGYAFINFKSASSIPAFYNEFNNKKWEKFNSEKVCQISYARIQGKQKMIEHFKNSSLLYEDPKCQPLIFQSSGNGKEEPCPIGNNFKLKPK